MRFGSVAAFRLVRILVCSIYGSLVGVLMGSLPVAHRPEGQSGAECSDETVGPEKIRAGERQHRHRQRAQLRIDPLDAAGGRFLKDDEVRALFDAREKSREAPE